MTLKRLYIKAVILPSIIVIVGMSILSITDPHDYTTQWTSKESIIFISILISFIYSLIICVLALTIFLNNKIIKPNGPASFLSWFLLPMTWIILALSKSLYHSQKIGGGYDINFLYLTVLNLPFVIGLVWTYILFRKSKVKIP